MTSDKTRGPVNPMDRIRGLAVDADGAPAPARLPAVAGRLRGFHMDGPPHGLMRTMWELDQLRLLATRCGCAEEVAPVIPLLHQMTKGLSKRTVAGIPDEDLLEVLETAHGVDDLVLCTMTHGKVPMGRWEAARGRLDTHRQGGDGMRQVQEYRDARGRLVQAIRFDPARLEDAMTFCVNLARGGCEDGMHEWHVRMPGGQVCGISPGDWIVRNSPRPGDFFVMTDLTFGVDFTRVPSDPADIPPHMVFVILQRFGGEREAKVFTYTRLNAVRTHCVGMNVDADIYALLVVDVRNPRVVAAPVSLRGGTKLLEDGLDRELGPSWRDLA